MKVIFSAGTRLAHAARVARVFLAFDVVAERREKIYLDELNGTGARPPAPPA
jgi:hypothetical protein